MTSKEALEKLCKVKIYQKEASAYDYLGKEIYKEEIEIIKQDLERLKELEKSNKEIEELYLNENKHWCETIDSLRNENEKLKKLLEILKKHKYICKNGDGFTITIWFNTANCDFKSCPTMEECLFVKEVLGNGLD